MPYATSCRPLVFPNLPVAGIPCRIYLPWVIPVGGLPGILSTKVRVLLWPGGVEEHPGELGIILVMLFCACFWASILTLLASLFAASGPVNNRAEALLWTLIGFAHFGFWILSGNCVKNKSLSIICSAKPNKALLVLISYFSKPALARPMRLFLISIIWCFRLEILLDYGGA